MVEQVSFVINLFCRARSGTRNSEKNLEFNKDIMDRLRTTRETVENYYFRKKTQVDFDIVILLMLVLVRRLAKKLLIKCKMFQRISVKFDKKLIH